MNFRILLDRIVASYGPDNKFTSYDIATSLNLTAKEASNSLRRLRLMKFLKKRRMKRACLSSSGKLCFKGYEYAYSVSSQGLSYIKWLKEKKPIEDLAYIKNMEEVFSYLPQELRLRLVEKGLMREKSKYTGPTRNLNLLDNNAALGVHLLTENRRVASENYELKSEKQALEADLRQERESYLPIIYGYVATDRGEKLKRIRSESKIDLIQSGLFNILKKENLNLREIRSILLLAIKNLPREKTEEISKLVCDIEKRGRAELSQRTAELHVNLRSLKRP